MNCIVAINVLASISSVGAVVVAATAGTAAVFVPAAIAGLKGAAIAGAASAATSVATEAVTTIVEGGTIQDFADDALVAARDGFAHGFMVGGIATGVTMVSNAALVHSNGLKIGSTSKPNKPRIEIGYGNPKVKGHTIININNSAGKSVFRIDFDLKHLIHAHYGATNTLMSLHRKGAASMIMGIVGGITGAIKSIARGFRK